MKDVRDFLKVLLLGAAVLILAEHFNGQYFQQAQQELGIDASAPGGASAQHGVLGS